MGERLKEEIENEMEIKQRNFLRQEQVSYLTEKEQRQHQQLKNIETSNTWKLGHLLHSFTSFWRRIFRRPDKRYIEELERDLRNSRLQIEALQTENKQLQLVKENLTTNKLERNIRDIKDKGELIRFLPEIIKDKNEFQTNYVQALMYIARLYMNEPEEKRNYIYKQIINSLDINDIPEFLIRAGLTDSPLSLQAAASFRSSLTMRMRQKQLLNSLPEWKLDDKRLAYHFVEQLDIVVPTLFGSSYTIETLSTETGVVIKPVDAAGARGVYLVHDQTNIFDVNRSEIVETRKQLIERMKIDLQTKRVEKDEWMVEQLIYENKQSRLPARDIKFYTFYGKVGLILEIIRDQEIRHCWWTRDGERITTGKYEPTLFSGDGVTEDEILQVERLSENIPAPFMRIDFLRSEDGLVFGEFTPKPGNYDEFNEEIDRLLGDYFLAAEGRLIKDLLAGKNFTIYKQFIEQYIKVELQP